MQIVIDIPKFVYDMTKAQKKVIDADVEIVGKAIVNGTPLPKGHGRLIILDEEKAKKHFTNFSFSVQDWISEVGISNATLKVIEADKAGKRGSRSWAYIKFETCTEADK